MMEDDVDEDQDGQTEQEIFPGRGKKAGNSFEIYFHLFLICIISSIRKRNTFTKKTYILSFISSHIVKFE